MLAAIEIERREITGDGCDGCNGCDWCLIIVVRVTLAWLFGLLLEVELFVIRLATEKTGAVSDPLVDVLFEFRIVEVALPSSLGVIVEALLVSDFVSFWFVFMVEG